MHSPFLKAAVCCSPHPHPQLPLHPQQSMRIELSGLHQLLELLARPVCAGHLHVAAAVVAAAAVAVCGLLQAAAPVAPGCCFC